MRRTEDSRERTGKHVSPSLPLAGGESYAMAAGMAWFLPTHTTRAAARAIGGGLAAGGLILFAIAASLTPPIAGFGAHEQLGLGPCSFPLMFGLPCPTCGMTTAFAYFAQGHPLASFHAQPAGFFLATGVAAATVVGLAFFATGRIWTLNWYRVPPGRAAAFVAGILLLGWAYKIVTVLLA